MVDLFPGGVGVRGGQCASVHKEASPSSLCLMACIQNVIVARSCVCVCVCQNCSENCQFIS